MFTTLIDAETLHANLDNSHWAVVDCRFKLAEPEAGRRAYQAGHIPGAVYAHLNKDLSNPAVTDYGRHPLPPPQELINRFSRMGIGTDTQVVAYDDANGMIAARLWWMLRYMGHQAVAVLDGGWQAWEAAGYAARSGEEVRETAAFRGRPHLEWLVLVEEVPHAPLLVDSRDAARYRGEMENIDPIAGHIPGAVNYDYQANWTADGRYRPAAVLRSQLAEVLGDTPPDQATFYCGSGVTACVNLLALAHAGLGNGRLYAGSWSEWCRDPHLPKATGSE
ncbi:MAG: sulfurtransferase [Ardenticatenaceae bacterium]|nr:sulfurtransferase [Ardenticatenaceae bacterium]MCB8987061.1 sulfurtransferase [Ardenticatenaceae bacterium]